jgi:hypothetical protein
MVKFIAFIAKVLKPIVGLITGELSEDIKGWVTDFRAKAADTPNPWDDILAEFLCGIFGIK